MPEYQTRLLKTPIDEGEVKVEFITSNSASKRFWERSYVRGVFHGMVSSQRVGDYGYGAACDDLNWAKGVKPAEGFRDQDYDLEDLKTCRFARAKAFRQGVGAALNYIVARKAIDAQSAERPASFPNKRETCWTAVRKAIGKRIARKNKKKQIHIVISAPSGEIQKRFGIQKNAPVDKIWDCYLVHRGTRMCDSYCTTLSMVPEWQLSRVIGTDIFQWDGHKSSYPLPLELIDSSIIDELRKCTHIHLFDDHIVYGDTMEDMLHSLFSTLTALEVNPWPVISCVSWFSLKDTPIQRLGDWWHEGNQREIPMHHPDLNIEHYSKLRNSGKLYSDPVSCLEISVGKPPPISEMFPITDLDSDESSFYCTVVNGNSNDDIERLPIGKEILDWYELPEQDTTD